MEILLNGASGFLGQQILPMLLAERDTVYVHGDRIDVVAHLAVAGVKASSRNWREAFEVNVGGAMKLLSTIKRNDTKNPRLVVTRG